MEREITTVPPVVFFDPVILSRSELKKRWKSLIGEANAIVNKSGKQAQWLYGKAAMIKELLGE